VEFLQTWLTAVWPYQPVNFSRATWLNHPGPPPGPKTVFFPMLTMLIFVDMSSRNPYSQIPSNFAYSCLAPPTCKFFRGVSVESPWAPPGPKNVIFPYAYNGIIFCVSEFSNTWQWNSSKLCSQLYGTANLWILQRRPGWIILGPPRAKNVIFPYAYNVNFCRQEFEKSWQWNYSKLCLTLSCPNNLRIFQGRPGWITLGPPGPKKTLFSPMLTMV